MCVWSREGLERNFYLFCLENNEGIKGLRDKQSTGPMTHSISVFKGKRGNYKLILSHDQ